MNKGIYTVVGLGKTGFSCVEFLVNQQLTVYACDTRENPPFLEPAKNLLSEEKISLGKMDENFLEVSDFIILSPGLSRNHPDILKQIEKGKPVIGDVELFCRIVKAPIVAITGTNGKSSVTALVGEMAKSAGVDVKVGGNIGTPVLEFLSEPEPELYVLELSSFQLESTYSLNAEVAVILNLTPDHLDQHGSFENYKKAKFRIFEGSRNVAVNLDDDEACFFPRHPGLHSSETRLKWIRDLPEMADVQLRTYSIKKPADFYLQKINDELFLSHDNQPLLSVKELKIKGMHQYSNALAALSIGSLINLPMDTMCEALKKFEGLPHRCQLIKEHHGVLWFNDSKATTVDSTLASVESVANEVDGKVILLAGGQGKQQDFSQLGKISKYLKAVILFGEDKSLIADVFKKDVDVYLVSDLSEAVSKANKISGSNDAVLLAPACASFDMFKNFEHRGESFVKLVENLS